MAKAISKQIPYAQCARCYLSVFASRLLQWKELGIIYIFSIGISMYLSFFKLKTASQKMLRLELSLYYSLHY